MLLQTGNRRFNADVDTHANFHVLLCTRCCLMTLPCGLETCGLRPSRGERGGGGGGGQDWGGRQSRHFMQSSGLDRSPSQGSTRLRFRSIGVTRPELCIATFSSRRLQPSHPEGWLQISMGIIYTFLVY
jgi:hypothetical protein